MRNGYGKTAVVAMLFLMASVPSQAGIDPSQVLVGRWEGDVQMAGGTYPRTLVIRSVQAGASPRGVEAEYGGTGNDYGGVAPVPAPVNLVLEAYGNDVILRFRTPEAYPVELTLSRDRRHLYGAMHISISRGAAWGINPVRLTKVE